MKSQSSISFHEDGLYICVAAHKATLSQRTPSKESLYIVGNGVMDELAWNVPYPQLSEPAKREFFLSAKRRDYLDGPITSANPFSYVSNS